MGKETERNAVKILFNSEERVNELKQRVERCCCKYCGSKLTLRQLVFHEIEGARLEIYCTHCRKIEYGVEQEIYQSAKKFVSNTEYNHFPDMQESDQRKEMNIAKICEIMTWAYRDAGLLTSAGFVIPIQVAIDDLDGCLVLSSSQIVNEEA